MTEKNKITALKYYREKTGKTQKEVAYEIGISIRQYQRYEAVDSTLGATKLPIIEKVAEVVGVTADDIIKDGIVILKGEDEWWESVKSVQKLRT